MVVWEKNEKRERKREENDIKKGKGLKRCAQTKLLDLLINQVCPYILGEFSLIAHYDG